MAYDNNQNESPLPAGNDSIRRRSQDHLPRYFRTPYNTKFLSSTLDQLIQPGVAEKLNGYLGRKVSKAFIPTDNYIGGVTNDRENYQFEPVAVIKDDLGNITYYKDYNDYINTVGNLGGSTVNHSRLNAQEEYAWNPHVDWDKLTNYREYYWLPNGPSLLTVVGQTKEIVSTYTVGLGENVDNVTYVFSPDGLTNNPTIKLYRGQTYRFDIDTPNHPMAFATKKSFTPGEAVIVESTDGVRSAGVFDVVLYDQEGTAYDAGGFIVDPITQAEAQESFRQGTATNSSLIYDTGVSKVDDDGNTVSTVYIEKGIIEFTIPDTAPDSLYYISKNDPNTSGYMQIFDIEENTAIDVEAEILGKKTYTTSAGYDLSNGMKIEFAGEVTPAKYGSGQWYVEGVGDRIQLIQQDDLTVSGTFTDNIEVQFDAQGFDFYPFSDALGYPSKKDYIVVNRASKDGNLWSRYNRWFHRSVIETSNTLSDNPSTLLEDSRAKRPIIEFNKGIKLFNFGTKSKLDVDLIDTFTKDIFSTIEGSPGYNVDGVNLTNGMRVLFSADTDDLVSGKIYKISFIKFKNETQISLVEETDTTPITNENVFVKFGTTNGGKFFTYDGKAWKLSQQKSAVNQQPLFDLFDSDGNSFGDITKYNSTTFTGNKIFSYKQGTGANDEELGFPLSYRNITNTGDITFNFDLTDQAFTYQTGTELFSKKTDTGFLKSYTEIDKFSYVNGWLKTNKLSSQPVIQQYIYDNTTDNFYIDVYDNIDYVNNLWLRVYLNNKLQFVNTDYTTATDVNGLLYITFTNPLSLDDVIVIKTKSKYPKNNNGYYEIAKNIERNPLNENITEFTLGEVNDHVYTIVEEINNFNGIFPGPSNLRDIGFLSSYGKKFLKHSGPINLSAYHLVDKDANVIKALRYARKEYGKFKRQFLQTANTLGFEGPVKVHVDNILNEMNKDKTSSMPFYFSDMVPQGGSVKTSHTVLDTDERYFPLSATFSMSTLSRKAVQVYLNGSQLTHGKDYTFNSEGFVDVTATKAVNDVIDTYEYDSTNASFMPPTPSKLGLYPSFEPKIYTDNTAINPVTVIQGHDGSKFVGFNDFRDNLLLELELRIYNNIKINYDTSILDIHSFVPGQHRDTTFTRQELNYSMTADFIQWSQLVDEDYVTHSSFDRNNAFTFNYSNTRYKTGSEKLPGHWRQAYMYAFDTDRPHTDPWEMLGFSVKPTWWETQYGPAPYTRNNKLLWQDLEQGIIREPNKNIIVDKKYIRPNLQSNIPVDDAGNILDPNACGLLTNFDASVITNNWVFGDGGPVETAWRRSSEYPFSLITAWVQNQPNNIFATGFDRARQKRNLANQIVYGDSGIPIKLDNIVFPNTISDTTQVFTSGLVNYIANYMTSNTTQSYTDYKTRLVNIKNQMGSKIAGYSDKKKFRLILDSRSPTNEGNVFVPDENYDLILNTSSPIKTISYSGVIIEKQADGYVIRGYDNFQPNFTYYRRIVQQNDPVINVGGISESFVNFSSNSAYTVGQIVKQNNTFFRVTDSHTSDTNFDASKFAGIPELPLVGGAVATMPRVFEIIESTLNYGDKLNTLQDVVDFLYGYGKYLTELGFVFEDRVPNSNEISDWSTASKQFMFWTTQNWAAGTVITLSPGANKLTLKSSYSIVDNIYDTFYGYSLLKGDGKKLNNEFVRISKGIENECTVTVVNSADGIFAVRFPLVQKEHVLIIDNKTVFNDVIYDPAAGYRQERIKVLGYRTDNWNGSLNIPGFIYDNAVAKEWEAWKDYSIGDLVKHKEFYYSSDKKIAGTQLFEADSWTRLDKKPTPGLLTNFDYKINQFSDFYDLDSDNFDVEQQKLAQHLIGYQKRQYLENIINDDVSQYKFYQGFILDKGSKNSLTKLFDALASADQESLDFFEEWAIKDGQYGASEGFEEVEYLLDEKKFVSDPQPILLTNNVTGLETDLVYRIKEYETYLKTNNYNHAPFPAKYITKGYTKDAGYVNPEDVDVVISKYDEITNKSFSDIDNQNYVWVGNYKEDWSVFQHVQTDYIIEKIESGTEEFTLVLNSTPLDINTGDVLGVYNVLIKTYAPGDFDSTQTLTQTIAPIEGFFKVKSVALNKIVLESSDSVEDVDECEGKLSKFISVRKPSLLEANTLAEQEINQDEKLWIDDAGNGKWAVLQNKNKFTVQQELSNSELGIAHQFGTAIAVDDRNVKFAVGSPDFGDGKVYIYNRASNALNYSLYQVLEPDENIASAGQKFGYSIAMSDDAKYIIVGAPNASNVKTNFKNGFSTTTNYSAGDIVSLNDSLWQADNDILGAVDNITFNSFDSVAQINYTLNNYSQDAEDIPVILTGDYPFKNITTDHFLLRAPKSMYNGSGVGDQIHLRWNSLANANQSQINLVERAPFDGTVPYLSKAYLESDHTISKKIDAILYVDASNNIPDIGDIVTTQGATGRVAYTHNESAQLTIYVNDVNGEFPLANSLFIDGNDFVGEYERIGPSEEITTADSWGGYWFVQSSNPYAITDTNFDTGNGLVYTDFVAVNDLATDSTLDGYYYQSLDYKTNVQDSESVINSYIQTLSFTGTPGPLGTSDPIISTKFVIRAPKELSDTAQVGDDFNLYLNNLSDIVTTITLDNAITVGAGEIITQQVTGATAVVKESVTNGTVITIDTITGTFDAVNLLTFSASGALGVQINVLPVIDALKDPSTIGLSFAVTNQEHTIDDIWDGYISYVNTKGLNGIPFEPIVGQTVRDVSTNATAEVAFYQRSGERVTIFVKDVVGNWSKGNQFGNNAEIEFLPYAPGPDPDNYGRVGIYNIPRIMGQIQRVSLGNATAGIGKLFVVDTGANITPPDGDFRTVSQLGGTITNDALTGDFAFLSPDNNFEYWIYKQNTINGIPRSANTPASDNLDWTEVYKIPTASGGSIGTPFTNEGIYYIYQQNNAGNYISLGSFVGSERQDNNYLGTRVEISKNSNNVYRGFISAPASTTVDNPGRIYFIKYGTENNIFYNWEYSKNKNYKGVFSESLNYFVGDIVSIENKLYNATTNIVAGTFNPLEWDSTDDLIDYVGYVPNDTGITIVSDSSNDISTVLDQGSMYDYANSFDLTPDGEVLIVNAKYGNDKPNLVVVYRILNGQYQRSQQIAAPSGTESFGDDIAISKDGKLIAIATPSDDSNKNNQGKVYIYKQVNGVFTYLQTLMSPSNTTSEFFGNKIDFDGSRLIVNAKNGDNWIDTTFDTYSTPINNSYILDNTSQKNLNNTTFDNEFTTYKKYYEQQGSVYVYEIINDGLLYAQQLQYQTDDSTISDFGNNFKLKNNHIYVGLPKTSVNSVYTGAVIDFRIPDNKNVWEYLKQPKDTVDISKIKRAILYNTKTNKLVTYLDYLDPVQGKVAGPAEQNLTYKTYYDPAYYSVGGSNVTVMPSASWGKEQVGELWWDLTNAKYLNSYQSDVIFSANNWNSLFEGNTIDVYEWVESTVLPSVWNNLSDTDEAQEQGIDGVSLYDDTVYSTRQTYDSITGSTTTKYYFWVKNKRTTPDVEFRTISSFDVANLIRDPKGQGYRFAALISPDSFTIYNCDNLLENKDIAFSVQYWTIDNQNINIHNQYQIVTDGLASSVPNRDIERKWFDSLVGYDNQGKQVPAPDLSPKQKYGILNSPRQSWFVNSAEALKQVIERVNGVLKENLIIDNKDLTLIKAADPKPSAVGRTFDTTVDTVADLEFIGVAKATQATMSLVIEDGAITRVDVINPGRGYLVAPTYKISGTGSGAELEFTINNLGVITNVEVINGGENYLDTDRITIRKYTALVNNDETILGKWALYERDSVARTWQRIASQSYDVSLFWDYIDWYAPGYNQFTEVKNVIDGAYQLQGIDDDLGDIIKINNVGTGGWLLLRKIANEFNVDYTVNYETIGRQNGTIAFKPTLYDTRLSATGFDIISFDSQFFDSVPSIEIRQVLNFIKQSLYTEELAIEYNRLFFASLRYVFSEQPNVDWAFKTSFVKAKHNVGQLREDLTFNNDSLPSYERYLEEVKPFKTKLREYLSAYEKIENSQSRITDFDLQPSYNLTTKNIQPQNVKVIGDNLIGVDDDLATYPYKNWTDNVGFKVVDIQIADSGSGYAQAPTIKLTGGGGSGATAIAKLGVNGTVASVEVTNKGSGYITAPTLTLTGSISETGKTAKLSAILGDGLTRGITNVVKFDRVSRDYSFTSINETETFAGTGSKYIFELTWPMDLKNTNVTVTVDNIELLRSEYTYRNVENTEKSYTRYHGQITLSEPVAVNTNIVIAYKKAVNLLTAQDRINIAYDPQTGQFAKDLSQLMDGVDYGGVQVKSFDFGGPTGWDTGPWFTSEYDTYDTTFEDETFELDGSTISIQLSKPLENGVQYNIYLNGVRIDDPNYGTGDPVTNPNARCQSITGNGVQTTIFLDNDGLNINGEGGAPADAEYNNGALIAENNGTVFDRALTVNGLKLVVAGAVGGQLAVPDEWAKKTARTFELMTDPNGAGINTTHQRNFLKTLKGDAGTKHAGIPTVQRVGYGGGSTYTPNWLEDAGVPSYAGLQAFNDSVAQKDMVWYRNINGNNPPTQRRDIEEIFEHIFHTIHAFGIPGAVPGSSDAVEMNPDIRIGNEPSFDWKNTALHLAMKEAIDAGLYDPSGYATDWNTDPEKAAVAYTEYTYLVNWSMWDMSVYWDGGSLSPEWDDSLKTPAGMLANNPLGYALFNTYFAPVLSKPNFATIESIFGENDTGVSGYVVDVIASGGDGVGADDKIIIRKSTSDGSFLPVPGSYDTVIEGGQLDYTTAQGILAEEINIDGDGFATPTNSGGPDEQLPGRVFDTVDIKVYERPTSGSSKIHSRNYIGDGVTTEFGIGTDPILDKNIFVKIDNVIQTDYTIDNTTDKVKFTTAPSANSNINIITLDYSGSNILDLDEFVADGSSADFLTNITYTNNLSSLVTIDGKRVEHVITKSNATYAAENRIVIRFAEPPVADAVVKYAIFEGEIQNFSAVTIDEFTADGSTTVFDLTQTPFTQKPYEWFTIVQVNDTILNAGYSQKYIMTDSKEYQLKLWQVPTGSLRSGQLRIYLNGQELTYIQDWTFTSAGQFNPALEDDEQSGSAILLNANVGSAGDILRVYVVGQEDSTASGGDYRYGYYDNNNNFVEDTSKLYIYSTLNDNDKIKIYQFSNHDSQGIERQSLDVVERTLLSPGVNAGRQVFVLDGSTANLNLNPPLTVRKNYAVYLNNVRIDDINYNTPQQVNNNAIIQTIVGAEQTVLDLQALGIPTATDDVIELVELGGSITPDDGTADWYELRQLRAGYVNLQSPAVDDQYVWVVKNGKLLDPSVDYVITPNKMRIKLKDTLSENDTIETFHFAKESLKNKFGWRQFKDILNRDIYKRLDGTQNYRLVEPLNYNDKVIVIENGANLPDPIPGSRYPGVIFIDKERIEYFRKSGNVLTQLRRGTLGTGVKDTYPVGTEFYDQSQTSSMPYKDEIITSTFTADGTSNTYELDFTPNSVNEFEVFVAGRRLRKTTLESYQLDTSLRTTYATSTEVISQDSPEGDVTLPAEFSISGSNLTLLETPGENQKVIIVRKQGRLWNDAGTALSNADSDISRFLRSTTVDLP